MFTEKHQVDQLLIQGKSNDLMAYVKDVDEHLENIEGIVFLREGNSKMLYKVRSGKYPFPVE